MQQITFDNNNLLQMLFSSDGILLERISRKLNVSITNRGNIIFIAGNDHDCKFASSALQRVEQHLNGQRQIFPSDIERLIVQLDNDAGASLSNSRIKVRNRIFHPVNTVQQQYIDALHHQTMIIARGVAGTGKTHLAVLAGLEALFAGSFERLLITRPVIEAGERIGFLPGDVREKIDPYLRPIYDACNEVVSNAEINRLIDKSKIEIAPLAYIRGRTFKNSFIILDEGQNTTPQQMQLFVTRFGENSRMVITGDPEQTDLRGDQVNGLDDLHDLVKDLDEVMVINFNTSQVIRHPLTAELISRYAARQHK